LNVSITVTVVEAWNAHRLPEDLRMISSLKRLWRDRRGNTLAIAGAALPLVLGSAGLASDTIQWTLWKRQLQRAADSAAAAGVYAIASGKAVGTCTDIAGSTYANPVAYDLKKNNQVGIPTTCTVTNPPSVGGYTADANAVRVALAIQKKLSFSGMFMNAAPTITATATATIVPSGEYCVKSLINLPDTGIDATGSTVVDLGCGMITNSTSMAAAVATGNASVKATPIAAVGGIPASDNWGTGTVLQPFTLATDDPFANVPIPTPTSPCQNFNYSENKPNGSPITITPAAGEIMCFKSDINIQGDVTFGPGVYVIDGASMSMNNNNAKLTCNNCTFVLTTSGTDMSKIGDVDLTGGKLTMTPPSSGTYKGILFYQDRRATLENGVEINGNSTSKIEGALYFPRADLTFNGTAGMNTDCMQIVSWKVKFTGNSGISNSCPSWSGASSFTGKKIRMVE
jgi:Flp pilus assembly protein TadG